MTQPLLLTAANRLSGWAPVAHHKRKRPKHRRSGCLLCKPQKLTASVKAERRRSQRDWVRHENAAS